MENVPSAAAQIIVTIIPIVGIVMGCTIFVLYIIFNYKQKKLMIEKGIYQRNVFDLDSFSLFTGLLVFCIGLSLMIFYLVKEGVSYGLLGGLIPLATGFALIVFFIIRLKMKKIGNEK